MITFKNFHMVGERAGSLRGTGTGMSSFQIAFSVVAPLMIYMVIGYLIRRAGICSVPNFKALNQVLFRVFIPLSLFFNVYRAELSDVLQPRLVLLIETLLILTVIIAASVFYMIELIFVFPLLASVVNDTRSMLKNAFLIGTHYLFATISVFAVHFAMFFVVVAWFTPLIILGEGLCAIVSAWLLNQVLIAVTTPAEVDE